MASFANIVPADHLNLDNFEDKQHDEGRLEDADLDLKNVPRLTPEQERKLWRKVDMRLVPILSLMYLLAFLDRGVWLSQLNLLGLYFQAGNIGNAKLEGLTTQLDLTGNKFNIALVCRVWFIRRFQSYSQTQIMFNIVSIIILMVLVSSQIDRIAILPV